METTTEEKGRLAGNLACFAAYAIFGFNVICCKDIALDGRISPMALFCLRAFGAAILFWLLSVLSPEARRERICKKDLPMIAAASLLGLFFTQLTFLKAMTMTTAIDAAVVGTLSPVLTLIISSIVARERIEAGKAGGIALSLAGVLLLVYNSSTVSGGAERTTGGGFALMFCNALCFALYLSLFRNLIRKYSVITFMKWMFLISSLAAMPFSFNALGAVPWHEIPTKIALEAAYVVFFATFVAYFLIPLGQKLIKPVYVCIYSYVQPVITMVIGLWLGIDSLSLLKAAATAMVFAGVAAVNFIPGKKVGGR